MSASRKKQLRKEQEAAVLTEKQLKEQKEAKKLKVYTIIFVAVMLVVAIIGLSVMVVRGVQSSGAIRKNTVAATVNSHEIDAVHMNYYYHDTINTTYSQWTSAYGDMAPAYVAMMGLDVAKPLNEQMYQDGQTWADYFLEIAMDRAKADYAMYDLAMAEGFTLDTVQQANLDSKLATNQFYASVYYGYDDVTDYLRLAYGSGASEESYKEYATVSAIATAYYNAYVDALTYDDAALRAHEADIYNNYSSYTFDSYYVTYNKYLTGGTKDETGGTVYTDEEKEAARNAAKADADILAQATTTKELDLAISALPVNAENPNASSTKNVNMIFTSVPTALKDWLSDPARVDGDLAVLPSEITATQEDGTENTELYGYYVVIFHSVDDNTDPMNDVRHLLVKFKEDEAGNVTNKDEAKAKAEEYLKTWKDGEATEDSFIELVMKHSEDSSAPNGGLFENIHERSSFVPSFLNWSIDENRKVGDAEVIESEYGYHVMYYVGESDLSYRDMLITEELKEADIDEWYNGIMETVSFTAGDTKFVKKDVVLASN